MGNFYCMYPMPTPGRCQAVGSQKTCSGVGEEQSEDPGELPKIVQGSWHHKECPKKKVGGEFWLGPTGTREPLACLVGGLAWWKLWLGTQRGLLREMRCNSLEEDLLHCSPWGSKGEEAVYGFEAFIVVAEL